MHSGKRTIAHPQRLKANQQRRSLLKSLLALPAAIALSASAIASSVNSTGLAVTDDTVKVGILHSVTGTMAISETGSVQAEKLAIEQINAMGGVLGRKIEYIQEDGASDWPTFAEKSKNYWLTIKSPLYLVAGHRLPEKQPCPFLSNTTACCITQPFTKAWNNHPT